MKGKTESSQAGPNRDAANREPGQWTGMKLNGCLALLGDQGRLHGIASNYPSGLVRGILCIKMGVMMHGYGRMWTGSGFLVSSTYTIRDSCLDGSRGPCARLEDGHTACLD